MAHYTTESLMRLGMKFTLQTGAFDEIIAEMKNYLEGYEAGILTSEKVMEEILERIEIDAHDFSDIVTEEYSDDSLTVDHIAHEFLLGILFEYIKHSDMQPNDFVKFITNHE